MRAPHVRLGATALSILYTTQILIIPPQLQSQLPAKFTFPKVISCSILRIGPYLFYIETFITQFKTAGKKIGHRTRFRENGDYHLPLWPRLAAKRKPPLF